MKRLLSLLSAVVIGSSAMAMSHHEYENLASQSIQIHLEEMKNDKTYLQELKERLKTRRVDLTDLSLTSKDFELYEKKVSTKEFERFQRQQKSLFKKIYEQTKRKQKLLSSKILKSWMEFRLTQNEKESLNYLLSLRYKTVDKKTPSLEADIIKLMQSYSAPSLNSYRSCGFNFSESLYARHMALYEQILEIMKENFDPMIYFHIESCMNAEEKLLIQSYLDDQLNTFAHSNIASISQRDRTLKDLLKTYFQKRKAYLSHTEFVYSS